MRRSAAAIPRSLVLSAVTVVVAAVLPGIGRAAPPVSDLPTRVASILESGGDWRGELSAELAALPAVSRVSRLDGRLSGMTTAGTAALAAVVELSADVTVLARRIQLTGRRLTVRANGHTLRLYPLQALTSGGASGNGGPIVMDVSGANGGPGFHGVFDGFDGDPGRDGNPGGTTVCTGMAGMEGDEGMEGGQGGEGGEGNSGNPAGDIVLDIPEGSTDSYSLIARGGAGGVGGIGASGGDGGRGGVGGRGGDGANTPPDDGALCDGGPGGTGGTGGKAGDGGTGGAGGAGGNGGTITVTYPSIGYDPGAISIDVSGGGGGGGGNGGFPGTPGQGGPGGQGGTGGYYGGSNGPSGSSGWGGSPGSSSFGGPGMPGGSGTFSLTPRGGPFSVSVNPSTAQTSAGSSVAVQVATTTVANPAPILTFAATGLPAGVTATFKPESAPAGSATQLTLAAGLDTQPGSYQIGVTADSAQGAVTRTMTLIVVGPPTGCSAGNETDVAVTAGSVSLSPIFISGCTISGPVAARVDVHIVHPDRRSLLIWLWRPTHPQQPGLDERLKDHSTSDSGPDLTATYYVTPAAIPADGGWTLMVQSVLGGSGYIDRWSISLSPMTSAPTAGPVQLVAAHSGACLDVTGYAAGAPATQRTCNGGPSQQWGIVPVTDGSRYGYRLVAGHTGMCLRPAYYQQDNGVGEVQQPCNSYFDMGQLWFLVPGAHGTYSFVHMWAEMCLDASAAYDGAPVQQWTCHGAANQRWSLVL